MDIADVHIRPIVQPSQSVQSTYSTNQPTNHFGGAEQRRCRRRVAPIAVAAPTTRASASASAELAKVLDVVDDGEAALEAGAVEHKVGRQDENLQLQLN